MSLDKNGEGTKTLVEYMVGGEGREGGEADALHAAGCSRASRCRWPRASEQSSRRKFFPGGDEDILMLCMLKFLGRFERAQQFLVSFMVVFADPRELPRDHSVFLQFGRAQQFLVRFMIRF